MEGGGLMIQLGDEIGGNGSDRRLEEQRAVREAGDGMDWGGG